jgi:hypothetical protein
LYCKNGYNLAFDIVIGRIVMFFFQDKFLSNFLRLTIHITFLIGIILTTSNVNAGKLPASGQAFTDISTFESLASSTQDVVVLTEASPDATINRGSNARVYGTAGINHITLKSGGTAELFNFLGRNTITVEADSTLFTVFSSGAYVTFEGPDNTVLKIPATTTPQSIVFKNGAYSLIIDSNSVKLGDQEIDLTPASISPVSGTNSKPIESHFLKC